MKRLYVSSKPLTIKRNLRSTYCVISICLLLSFIWASLPLFGWSSYQSEGLNTSCNINWTDKSLNNLSYFIVVWTLAYVVPLICIFFSLFVSLILVSYYFIFTSELLTQALFLFFIKLKKCPLIGSFTYFLTQFITQIFYF